MKTRKISESMMDADTFGIFQPDLSRENSQKKWKGSEYVSETLDDELDKQQYMSQKQRHQKGDEQDGMDYEDYGRFKKRDEYQEREYGDDCAEDELMFDNSTSFKPPLCSTKKVVHHKEKQKQKSIQKTVSKSDIYQRFKDGPIVKELGDNDSVENLDSPKRVDPDTNEDFFGVLSEKLNNDDEIESFSLYRDHKKAPGYEESKGFVADFGNLGGDVKKSKKANPKRRKTSPKTKMHRSDSILDDDVDVDMSPDKKNISEKETESYSTYSQHPVKFDSAKSCSDGLKKFHGEKGDNVEMFDDYVISKTGYSDESNNTKKMNGPSRSSSSTFSDSPKKIDQVDISDNSLLVQESKKSNDPQRKNTDMNKKTGNYSKNHASISKMFQHFGNQSSPKNDSLRRTDSKSDDSDEESSQKKKRQENERDDERAEKYFSGDDDIPSSENLSGNILNEYNSNFVKKHFSIYMGSTGKDVDDLIKDTCPMCTFGGLNIRGRIGIEIERTKQVYRKKAMSAHNKSLAYLLSQMWNTRVFDTAVKLDVPMLPLTVEKAYEHISKPHVLDRAIVAKCDITKLNDIEDILCDRLFFVKSTVRTTKTKTKNGSEKSKSVTDSELTYRPQVLRDLLLVVERKRRLMLVRKGDSIFTTSSKKVLTGSDNSQLRIKFG